MEYRLYAVRVFVTRWDEAVTFYNETLGMPLTHRDDELGWAQFNTGEAQVALERVDPADAEKASLVGRFVGVSLGVGNIAGVHAMLSDRGVRFHGPPEEQSWGGLLCQFEDLEGNILTLLGQGGSGA